MLQKVLMNRSWIRMFHSRGRPRCRSYQINYDQLREGNPTPTTGAELLSDMPQTVTNNVKNVVGWRGGAERGFLAAYPDCIHVLTQNVTKEIPTTASWYLKVLTHNLSSTVLTQRYGILVPITYKQLFPQATKDEMNQAHVLGWCVEMVRAASIVTTDTIANESSARYGIRKDATWSEKHNLGNTAFNDALLIERGIFVLLKNYFPDSAHVFYDAILRAQRIRALGRTLGHRVVNYESKANRLDEYNIKNYKALLRSHVSGPNFCLPISLALHLAGMHEEKLHELAHQILHDMGYYVEVTRDFTNCYMIPDGDADIHEGRLTWLIVLALQRANPEYRQILEANYGSRGDQQKAELVKKIYDELNLKKTLMAHIDEKRSEILSRIQGISKLDNAGLSQEFFFKLLDNMDMHNIS